ncbi:uncharacterized protein [Scyliorhinus torazame]|uniref:uncharacterized protein isoform X2 n=1 Tax=Scyliorhinus torazame TaxID=75743 RepID=UPI003B5AEAEA
MSDDYDSTWAESEEEPESATPSKPREMGLQLWNAKNHQETEPRPSDNRSHSKHEMSYRMRNWRAAKDLQRYRHGYPDLDNKVRNPDNINYKFYMNEKASQPDDWTIEEMITNWKGKYEQLERNHSYIQWLFPLREPGMNWFAKELTKCEIKLFKESDDAKRRLIEAYKMMLDFYGIKLVNRETGAVKRAHHWRKRFNNLNLRMHNNLRITRMLKCLGEMGFEHYQPPLVKFFLTESLIRNQLPNVKESVLDYFLYTIRSKSERRKLILFAQMHYKPSSEFVWGPPKAMESRFSHILQELNKEEETASEESSDEDTPAKAEESSLLQEAGEERSSKQRRLTKQRSSDTRVKSTNDVKDTKEGSEDRMEAKNLDEATSCEERIAEEKSDVDEKSPVPENKSNLKENLEEQPVQVEDVVTEGQNMEERAQGNDVPTCPTKHEKVEDDLKIQGDESDAPRQKEKESKKNELSSREAEPFTIEEDEPVREGRAVNKPTEEDKEPEPVITEVDSPATEGSLTGKPAAREPEKTTQPQPLIAEEDKHVKGESEARNITEEGPDEEGPDEDAKSELVPTEKNKSPKEEGKVGFMEIERSNVSTELEIDEGQSKSVSESKIQSSTEDESECMEEMETQEAALGHPVKDVKYPGGSGVVMETEASKPHGEEEDVEMEDGQ